MVYYSTTIHYYYISSAVIRMYSTPELIPVIRLSIKLVEIVLYGSYLPPSLHNYNTILQSAVKDRFYILSEFIAKMHLSDLTSLNPENEKKDFNMDD